MEVMNSASSSPYYREYMRHYARERFGEALAALESAIQAGSTVTDGGRLEIGTLTIEKGVLLHRLSRQAEAIAAFGEAEGLVDPLTFAAHMATFCARFGNDPQQALAHADRVLEILEAKRQTESLDDGEQYYARTAMAIKKNAGRL